MRKGQFRFADFAPTYEVTVAFYRDALELPVLEAWDRHPDEGGTLFGAGSGMIEVLAFPQRGESSHLWDDRPPQGRLWSARWTRWRRAPSGPSTRGCRSRRLWRIRREAIGASASVGRMGSPCISSARRESRSGWPCPNTPMGPTPARDVVWYSVSDVCQVCAQPDASRRCTCHRRRRH
jgi:hypothetical protein